MVSPQESKQLREMNTTSLGRIQYTEDQRFKCPHGLLGFEQEQRFILIEDPKVAPFQWLQSEEDGDLAFLVINPVMVQPDYTLAIDRNSLKDLNIEKNDQTIIYVIATLGDKPQDTTLNFKGPLVFNLSQRVIQQVVNEKADTKTPLFQQKP